MRIALLSVVCLFAFACGRTEPVDYSGMYDDELFDAGVPDAGRELVPCMTGELIPTPAVPAVMLVVDRSGSMNFDFAGNSGGLFGNPLTGPRRWSVLRTTLENTLSQVDQQVAFGMVQFPSDNECGVSSSIELLPRAGNGTEILRRLMRTPTGGTPTADAVNKAGDQLSSVRGQALVLITDGDPNCNEALDPVTCDCTSPLIGFPPECSDSGSCRDAERTTDAIRKLREDKGIITYVIGVGAQAPLVLTALDNMAVAGGVPRMGGPRSFYSGETESEFTEAMNAVSAHLTRCTWATNTKFGANDVVEVRVGGDFVPQGATGWDWVDPATGDLTLKGTWCERAAAGEEIKILLQCR